MNEEGLLARWAAERAMYCAWGTVVEETVLEALKRHMPERPLRHFLRLPTRPREKTGNSLVEKALYRGKDYDDPYVAVTDKVGVRFVVLLASEIEIIETIVETRPIWNAEKDRDFLKEREKDPIHFSYSAMHYIVRNREDLIAGTITVPAHTPCEVQIKTILQHAYSELTHDTIYKPMIDATSDMLRSAAKSMALIEATNDYFQQVTDDVDAVIADVRGLSDRLSVVYGDIIGAESEVTRLEAVILRAFKTMAGVDAPSRIREFLADNAYVADKIRAKREYRLLYRQPSILLVYYLAKSRKNETGATWPLTPAELEPVYADLGIRFET